MGSPQRIPTRMSAVLSCWRSLASVVLAVSFLTAAGAAAAQPGANDASAASAAQALSPADQACIGCHATEGVTKALASGETLSLAVDATAFAGSVHRLVGCAGCHGDVKPDHFANGRPIASAREYKVAQTATCRNCHDRVFGAYEGSMHAAKLREGHPVAPTCADCHSPHAVTPASIQDGPRNACLTCHAGSEEQHAKWLPNAARHLEAVACSACHAPGAMRKVDLRLFDARSDKPVTDGVGGLAFEKVAAQADVNRDGLDASEFRAVLSSIERGGAKLAVRGYVDLRSGVDAHQLPLKSSAIKDCVACHREDAAPFQRVTVSVMGADGRRVRYDAHKAILTSAITVDALREFYAIGGTRIKLLDVLLALGLVAGIAVPSLHLLLKYVVRRRALAKDQGEGQ